MIKHNLSPYVPEQAVLSTALKVRKKNEGHGENKLSHYGMCFILLEELIVLLVQADSVLTPELLRLVHRTPFQAARLEFRAILIK